MATSPQDPPGLWSDALGSRETRASLAGEISADVVVVGGGFSGLWTAYYLKEADPALRVVILEASRCGFGASGRNGGWASALFPTSLESVAARYGKDAARSMYRGMIDALSELEKTLSDQGIDCDFHRGGSLTLARNLAQMIKINEEVSEARAFGFEAADVMLLGPKEATRRIGAVGVLGASYTPHCATVHPGKLVAGLVAANEARGVEIFEGTKVDLFEAQGVSGDGFRVHAKTVVRATEAFTSNFEQFRHESIPVYSLMIATEVLSDAQWEAIGWEGRETLSDGRGLIIYGQRTADGRVAFGGRGAPYHFGSKIDPRYDRNQTVANHLYEALCELFPTLEGVGIERHWGGPIGIRRDFFPSVGYDPKRGFAWTGGYVGDGVTTSYLGGRTLADLITNTESERRNLCWVDHKSRNWEREPLRWLGVNAALSLTKWSDIQENKGKIRPWSTRVSEFVRGGA